MANAAVALNMNVAEAMLPGKTETLLARTVLRIERECYEFRTTYGAFPTGAPEYLLQLQRLSLSNRTLSNRASQDWKQIFEEFAVTGVSLQAFCRGRGVNYEAAKKARQRLRKKNEDIQNKNRDIQGARGKEENA